MLVGSDNPVEISPPPIQRRYRMDYDCKRKATTIGNFGWNVFPEVMDGFARMKEGIGTPKESQILQAIYHNMPLRNFSSDFLPHIPECVGVMELEGVLWSDWRNPARIAETLRQIGKKPSFPQKNFLPFNPYKISAQQVTEVQ